MTKKECRKCHAKTITPKTGIHCSSSCGHWFHLRCVGLTSAADAASWTCTSCSEASRRIDHNISQESQPSILSDTSMSSPPLRGIQRHSAAAAGLFSVPCDFANALSALQKTVQELVNEQKELVKSASFQSSRLDDFERMFGGVPEAVQVIQSLVEERDRMAKRIGDLELQVDVMDQRGRADNVEIRGIPFDKSENLASHLDAIAKFVGVQVSEADISYVRRAAGRAPDPRAPSSSPQPPSAVIVKFTRKMKRDEFLKKARGKRPITAKCLGMRQDVPIYVNEHLTLRRKKLLAKTRALAKEKNIMFVWVHDGDILTRKDDKPGTRVKSIKHENDFLKLN